MLRFPSHILLASRTSFFWRDIVELVWNEPGVDIDGMGQRNPGSIICVLGQVSITLNGSVVPITSRRVSAVIAMVALSGHRKVSREKLCLILWPDAAAEQARTNLRQVLRRLKSLLNNDEEQLFNIGRDAITLADESLVIDTDMVLSQIKEGTISDELVDDDSVLDSMLCDLDGMTSALDAWLVVQRSLLSDRLNSALQELLVQTEIGDPKTVRIAKALTSLDPTNEGAQRIIMESLTRQGQASAAIRVYDDLYRLLEDDYDIEPSVETSNLVAKIKLGEISENSGEEPGLREPSPRIAQNRTKPVIAIRPFSKPDGSPGSALATSFYRDLVSVMVRFREWVVVENYTETGNDGFYLLEGVEMSGNQADSVLSVILKNLGNGHFLWSERFPIAFKDWQNSQWKIAQRFAVSIGSNLTFDRLNRRARSLPVSEAIFDRWLRCQELIANWTPETGREVETTLREITNADPGFAPAHAELAALFNSYHLVFNGAERTHSRAAEALRHAQAATEIDPLDTRSQRTLAWAYLMDGHAAVAETHFDQALDLNETNPYTAMSAAQGLAFCGNHDRAAELVKTATSLQRTLPAFLQGYRVGVSFLCDDLTGAVDAAEVAEDSISNLRGWKASALWTLGEHAKARQAADAFFDVVAPSWCGPAPASKESIHRWFADAFPIQEAVKRARLNDGLRLAMQL